MSAVLGLWLTVGLMAGPAVGEPLPWFAGWGAQDQVINRTQVLKGDARGRALVLFATWCAPCEAGLAALRGARDSTLKGVDVTLVACGESPAVVQPWLAARGWGEARVIYDRFGTIARDLGVEQSGAGKRTLALPRVIVADGAGTVRAVLDGDAAHDPARIARALAGPHAKPKQEPKPKPRIKSPAAP